MKDVNRVILVGRLGADPIQRETRSGTSVVHFPLATSRKGKDESQEETQWHKVVVWGKQAEACARYLGKGRPIYLEGMIRSSTYEGQDGKPRYSFEIHADQVSFLPKGRTLDKGASSHTAQEEAAL